MSTIVTRAGKGSPLTNNEVDSNFTNLNTDKVESITSADGSVVVATSGTTRDLSVGIAGSTATLISQVRNQTGATLTKGTIVYISGAAGNKALVSKALATSDATSAQTYGVIQADILNNQNGYVVVIGAVSGLNTSAYADGTQLYLSGVTAGTYTSTKPYAPTHLVYVGVVTYSHATQGTIQIKIQNGYEMDELHDVSAQSPTNGDTLVFNSTTSLWTKTAQSAMSVGSAATLATARNINGVSFNGSADITVADATKLPLTGGTLSGVLNTSADIQQNNATYLKSKLVAGTATRLFGLNASDTLYIGSVDADHTGGTLFVKNGVTQMSLSASGVLNNVGAITQNGNQVLHATNYNSYAPTLTGTGASGSWGISVTGSAAKWTTARTETLSGDVTGSASVDGSANWSITTTLANSGVTAGTYTKVTVDAKGRVTTGASLASADLPTYTGTITSSQITTGLGFTPYNATNPSGYITSSANITGTAAGLTDNSSWMLSRGSITEASIDSATSNGFYTINRTGHSTSTLTWNAGGSSGPVQLDFHYSGTMQFRNKTDSTTWNAWKTVLTSANYTSYTMPLSGGATWNMSYFDFNQSNTSFRITSGPGTFFIGDDDIVNLGSGAVVATPSSRIASGVAILSTYAYATSQGDNRTHFGYYNGSSYVNYIRGAATYFDSSTLQVAGNQVLHAGNYNGYAPTLTGAGASGSWGISVTGSAGSVAWSGVTGKPTTLAGYGITDAASSSSLSSYLPLSGGTVSGLVTFTRDGGSQGWSNIVIDASPAANGSYIRANRASTAAGEVGFAWGTGGSNQWINYMPTNSTTLQWYQGSSVVMSLTTGGVLSLGGNAVLHAGNYNSYAPTLTGGGASGTWSINVTGNAGSATTAAKSSATTVPASTAFTKWLFATNSTSGTQDWNHVSNTRPGVGEVLLLGNHANGPGGGNYYHPLNFEYSSIEGSGNVTQLAIAYGSPGNELYMRGSYSGSWNGWNRFLNSNNYSSYALPLSGGTLSGDLRVNTIRDTAGGWVLGKYGTEVSLGSAGLVNEIRFNSSANAAFEYRGNAILHAGNYSSYALPISGGSLTGALSAVSGLRSYYSDHIAGDGYGIRFWESNAYKISMGASSLYQYGTVTDYSIKMQMDNGSPGRGFTWGRESYAPIASLNATSGNFQTAGQMYVQGAQIASGAFTVRAGGASGVGWGTGLNIGDSSNYSGFIQDAGISRWRNTGSGGYDWFNSATTQIMALSNSGYLGVGQASDASYRIIASGHIYANANGNVYAEGRHYSRHGTGTFYESLTTGNYSSYALPLSGGILTGSLTINNGDPTIYFQDTDHRSAMIHVNSNTFYVLRGSGTNSGSWATANGYWPLTINLENNNAEFGGSISSVGNTVLHAGNFSSYSHSIATSDSRYSRKDTTSQWIKPYYEYGSYLTSESPATLKDQMGGGGLRVDFMNPSYTGSGGWNHVITWSGYNMYNMYQLGGHYDGGTGTDLWVRSEANHGGTSWTAWRKLLNSSNYNSYSPTLTGGNASGTWGINISGRGYPRRSDGNDLNFYWSGQSGQPTGLWGGSDGANMYVYNPSNFSVARAQRANGNFYIDDNYGNGVVGVYSSYRYQGVFAMGDSYKLPADGTTTGSLYGMAWSHPNAGGAAGNLSDHGLLIINNGVFRCAISNSIVAASNITAYSDERLKTNWRDMPENFVARLAQVKVGIYDRTDEEDVTQVGVSAQSFQKLLPQAIMKAKDEMGTLSVSYGNAALASAVELAKDNVELRARIERLESLINKLIGD